jgi:hypothetical protein
VPALCCSSSEWPVRHHHADPANAAALYGYRAIDAGLVQGPGALAITFLAPVSAQVTAAPDRLGESDGVCQYLDDRDLLQGVGYGPFLEEVSRPVRIRIGRKALRADNDYRFRARGGQIQKIRRFFQRVGAVRDDDAPNLRFGVQFIASCR